MNMETLKQEIVTLQLKCNQLFTYLENLRTTHNDLVTAHTMITLQNATLNRTDSVDLSTLSRTLESCGPTNEMQEFANKVIASCIESESGVVTLWQSKCRVPSRYRRVRRQRTLKADAQPSSRKRWLKIRANELMDMAEARSNEGALEILKIIAKRSDIFVAKRSDISLSIPQSIATQDHGVTGTNGLYRLKQALDAFCPALKGVLIPPNIRKHVCEMECKGVVPSKCVEVDCTITKKGNRRGMCTFYYSAKPTQLLSYMLRRMFLDNTVQGSFDFLSQKDVLVISIGFDKSDSVSTTMGLQTCGFSAVFL